LLFSDFSCFLYISVEHENPAFSHLSWHPLQMYYIRELYCMH
jgi:hypothetical protein